MSETDPTNDDKEFWSSDSFSARTLQTLLFELEEKYEVAVLDLSAHHGLEPQRAPTGGPELYWRQYALGIARYRSLFALNDVGLSDSMREYVVTLFGEAGKELPSNRNLSMNVRRWNAEFTEECGRSRSDLPRG
jgi:hypothetical protein